MAYRVLIPQDVKQEGKDYLTERGYEIKMGSGIEVADIVRDVEDCDAILARTAPFPREVIEAGKKLKVVARHGVGFDNIDVKRAEELGIWVTNAPESNSNTVAEHALLLILGLARKILVVTREFKAGNFAVRNQQRGMDVEGKVLGIAGMGKIGRLVARKALAFDMKVVGYDPFLKPDDFPDGVSAVDWEELFKNSDFISLHMPATEETKNIVGAKEFAMMKPTAFLVNAARGEVVDEPALIKALQNDDIGGAGLDVFSEEPLPPDSPLLQMDSVLSTPHNAALTDECMVRMAIHAAMGIDDVLNGRTPKWPVNNPNNTKGS